MIRRRKLSVVEAELKAARALVAKLKRERWSIRSAALMKARNVQIQATRRLPKMTRRQRRTYNKMRYVGGLTRGVALAAALSPPAA